MTPGLEILAADRFRPLRGMRVGLVCNPTAVDRRLRHAADLLAAKGKIASFKIPRYVTFVKEFPMTGSGKIQKFKLKELALESLEVEPKR